MSKPIGIFIAEDEGLIISFMQKLFATNEELAFRGSAINGEECLRKIKGNPSIDIVLMDIKMNGTDDGMLTAKEIIRRKYPVKIIFLTNNDHKEFIQEAVEMNIPFVRKNIDIDRLFEIIKKVYYKNEMIIELGGSSMTASAPNENAEIQELRAYIEDVLTKRQLEIARLVGVGNSNKEIAEMLNLSIHTVNTNCKNIYAKLDCNRNQLIHIITKSGLFD